MINADLNNLVSSISSHYRGLNLYIMNNNNQEGQSQRWEQYTCLHSSVIKVVKKSQFNAVLLLNNAWQEIHVAFDGHCFFVLLQMTWSSTLHFIQIRCDLLFLESVTNFCSNPPIFCFVWFMANVLVIICPTTRFCSFFLIK